MNSEKQNRKKEFDVYPDSDKANYKWHVTTTIRKK